MSSLRTTSREVWSLRRRAARPLARRYATRIAVEAVEPRIAPAALPMTFSVPGLEANQGVYVGITGQLESAYTPTYGPYAGQMLPSGSWVVLATNPGDPLSKADYALTAPVTTLAQPFTPGNTGATMTVASTSHFPPNGGQLTLLGSSGATVVSYTSVTPRTSFNNVVFVAGVAAQNFPSGSAVVLANQNLPLLNLFPNSGSYPPNNDPVTAQVGIPDFMNAPIQSGQVVMSVGSAMKLAINPGGSVSSPSVASNPNDKFGLFEWGWDSQNGAIPQGVLDLDISEVDQVGFPFQARATNPTVAITGVTVSGNIATITTKAPHHLQAGDTITIAGVGGATNVNGTTFVLNPPASATQFQVLLPVPTGTYTSGGTVSLLMPAPAEDGVGLKPDRTTLFNGFNTYINLINSQYPSSNATVFLGGAADNSAAPFPVNTRITAPQDVVDQLEGSMTFLTGAGVMPIQYMSGGSLQPGTYYYAVTAIGPNGGESLATVPQSATVSPSASTPVLNWNPYAYATGYNVYRATQTNHGQLVNPVKLNSAPIPVPTAATTVPSSLTLPSTTITVAASTNPAQFPKVGSLMISGVGNTNQLVQYTGYNASTHQFTGVTLGTGKFQAGATVTLLPNFADTGMSGTSAPVPPTNNYNYDPLNQYFTTAITDFFNYYATNTFVLDLGGSDQTTFVGTTSTTVVPGYTVLDLVGQAGQFGGAHVGQHVHIYEPFFSSNTNGMISGINSYPAPPSWLTSPSESPSSMVFAADGVFDTTDGCKTQPMAPTPIQQDVMNTVVSAFNRGLTPVAQPGGQYTNVLPPTYWGNDPNPLIGAPVQTSTPSGNQPLSGVYYYAITAVNVNNSDTVAGETTPSNIVRVNVNSNTNGNNSVFLQWKAVDVMAQATITSASASAMTITVDNVTNFPAKQGSLLVTVNGMPEILAYGTITLGTGTRGTFNNVVVQTPKGTFPTTAGTIVYGNVGAPTAQAFNIYRGTSPDNLTLIQTVPNATPAVVQFVDTGFPNPANPTPPPFVYYANGSTANYYAAYLHKLDVSINGLAYGFPFDDQGGFSTNLEIRTPKGVTITLVPWGKASAGVAPHSVLSPLTVTSDGPAEPPKLTVTPPQTTNGSNLVSPNAIDAAAGKGKTGTTVVVNATSSSTGAGRRAGWSVLIGRDQLKGAIPGVRFFSEGG